MAPTTIPPIRSSIARVFAGTATGQLLTLLALPVIARIYGPRDIGALALFAGLATTIASVASFRYEAAIALPRSRRAAIALTHLSVSLAIITSVATAILTLVAHRWVPRGVVTMPPVLLAFNVLGTALYNIAIANNARTHAYTLVAATQFAHAASRALLPLAFALYSPTTLSLMLSNAVAPFVGLFPALYQLQRRGRGRSYALLPPLSITLRVAAQYRSFPLWSAPASLANTASCYIPTFVVGHLYGLSTAGMFALAERALSLPRLKFTIRTGTKWICQIMKRMKRAKPPM